MFIRMDISSKNHSSHGFMTVKFIFFLFSHMQCCLFAQRIVDKSETAENLDARPEKNFAQ